MLALPRLLLVPGVGKLYNLLTITYKLHNIYNLRIITYISIFPPLLNIYYLIIVYLVIYLAIRTISRIKSNKDILNKIIK